MGGEKESAQRRLLDWEPGAPGEPQHKEGGPSRGSRDGARAHLTKEQVFIVMSAPFASEKGVSTNKTQILCVRESSSQIPMSSHSGPTFQEMNTYLLFWPPHRKPYLSPRGEVAGQLAGTFPMQIRACFLFRCHSRYFVSQGSLSGVRVEEREVVAFHSLGWIQCCAPITRHRISNACVGTQVPPVHPAWFPSAHSVTVFPPLIPYLSLTPKSSPCYTIFCKWTSHCD